MEAELKAVLDKFQKHSEQDMAKLYQTNMLFNVCVNELARGGSEHRFILKLLGVVKQQADLNAKLMMENIFPINFIPTP